MSAIDGDTDGDINQFWQDRNYNLNVGNVQAAVFESQGLNDDNVRPNHFGQWWAGLTANNVPRKLWLSQEGHVDPFDYRRAAWVDTLHRWFDYWLQGVPNGIMSEPQVDIETAPNTWETQAELAASGHEAGRCLPQRDRSGLRRQPRPQQRRQHRLAHLHRREPERDELPLAHELAGEQAAVPLVAVDARPAHLRHADRRHHGLAQQDAVEPERVPGRLRRRRRARQPDEQRGRAERDDVVVLRRQHAR